MNNKLKKALWFVLSFGICFGSYLIIHTSNDMGKGYGPISAGILSIVYLVLSPIIYLSFRKINKPFASGAVWGVVSIFIFLFTIGGCGIF